MLNKKIILIFLLLIAQPGYCATITGTIVAKGKKPQFRPIATSTDSTCPGSVYPNIFVIGDNGELANVLVYIKEGLPEARYYPPSKPVVLNQIGCRFKPHVFAAMVGQQVVFLTSDPTLHTVDFHSKKNKKFAVEMPKNYQGGAMVFDKEEFMIPIMCSVHPWMLAFANILSHPYFFVSEPNGRYLIQDVPVGTYTIEAWHEKLGKTTKEVIIENATDFKTIDFNFPLR